MTGCKTCDNQLATYIEADEAHLRSALSGQTLSDGHLLFMLWESIGILEIWSCCRCAVLSIIGGRFFGERNFYGVCFLFISRLAPHHFVDSGEIGFDGVEY